MDISKPYNGIVHCFIPNNESSRGSIDVKECNVIGYEYHANTDKYIYIVIPIGETKEYKLPSNMVFKTVADVLDALDKNSNIVFIDKNK